MFILQGVSMLQYQKYDNYDDFNKAKQSCRECPIGNVYNCVVPSDGNTTNPKVVIIGECPGSDELVAGKPFVGKAGKLLRSTLTEMGFTNENSLITNTIPCRPQDNQFPKDEKIVKSCKNTWLREELRLTSPDVIILIGAKPLKFLLNLDGITKTRGKWFERKLNGKIVKLIATYHPSYVLRKEYMEEGKQIKEDFRNDLKLVSKTCGISV